MRAHISLRTKLASALLQMVRYDAEEACFVRIIPHEEAKTLTADAIIARFHFDHDPIPHAEGGVDEPWNLTPVPVEGHREKTAKVDVPGIAKRKRLSAANEEFRRRILAKPCGQKREKRGRIASRPFPKGRKFSAMVRGAGERGR